MTKRLLLLLLPVWLLANRAHAEYFTIIKYHIGVTFTADGEANFEETIEVEFSEPRHGIFRQIPLRSIVDGKTVDRLVRDVAVDGFKFSTSRENNNLVLKIGDADVFVEGRQTYRIRYRVLNPLNFFEEHSEFYWDLLGISWPVVAESGTFDLIFPDQVGLSETDVRCFTGQDGATGQDVEFQVLPNRVTGRGTQKFMPGEGLTVAVRLPGTVFRPMDSWTYFRERHGLLLAPLYFLIAGILALFMARNRRQIIMTEFFPPDGISPAIAGGFVDHSVDQNDVLCLIPHLANQGYLRLEMEEGGFLQKDNVIFYKLKEAGPELMEFEKQFFDALFSTGSRVELRDLKDKFYMHLNSVRTAVTGWIQEQGWYEPDQKTMGCITALGGLGALIWGGYAVFGQENLDGIALMATGIALFVFSGRFNKRTPLGNETYRKLEGFRQFVKKAERPVIERLLRDDPLYYDKTMPYALAFGYLKHWNNLFDGLLTEPPSWYGSPGMMRSNLNRSWGTFAESFPSEINNIGSVFSSAPSSSSSGGGGGGSSGGGSGGGGGGSW
ncbi:MAG: DUF2207 domain-containing protein [Lewinellaceae bacterium]|nr:DUF2207 domain-containing protein [Lewinellaceae bacterium]